MALFEAMISLIIRRGLLLIRINPNVSDFRLTPPLQTRIKLNSVLYSLGEKEGRRGRKARPSENCRPPPRRERERERAREAKTLRKLQTATPERERETESEGTNERDPPQPQQQQKGDTETKMPAKKIERLALAVLCLSALCVAGLTQDALPANETTAPSGPPPGLDDAAGLRPSDEQIELLTRRFEVNLPDGGKFNTSRGEMAFNAGFDEGYPAGASRGRSATAVSPMLPGL